MNSSISDKNERVKFSNVPVGFTSVRHSILVGVDNVRIAGVAVAIISNSGLVMTRNPNYMAASEAMYDLWQ